MWTHQDLEAKFDILQKRTDVKSRLGDYLYEPVIFMGARNYGDEVELQLSFLAHILKQIQGVAPVSATIVAPDGYEHKTRLAGPNQKLRPALRELRYFSSLTGTVPPLSLVGLHSHGCKFNLCVDQAKESDSLSLLGRMTRRIAGQYAKKRHIHG
jgi:predicted RecB family nuclease